MSPRPCAHEVRLTGCSFLLATQPDALKTLEGGSDTWAEQLATWRQDGWELLSVVTEGEERRAILERRL